MPVVRARMDLAVMLASRGRLDEARTLMQRAIHAVEHRVGDDDARLAIVLENSARMALAAGSPANAEPLLIRLHALLDAHDMSTGRAEELLARVAAVRSQQVRADVAVPHAAAEEAPAAEALAPEVLAAQAPVVATIHDTPERQAAFEDDLASRVYAHATIDAHEEWEDQPLRDAVAVTDILLRTTPSGVPIIPVSTPIEPPLLIVDDTGDPADLPGPFDAFANFSFDLADTAPAVPETLPAAESLDTIDLSFATPLSVRAEEAPIDEAPVDLAPVNGGMVLDFTVAHGVVDELDDAPMLQAPPVSSPIPDALPDMPAVMEPPTVSAEPTQIVSSGSTRGIAPMADMVGTAPPVATPAPAPVAAAVASPEPTERPAPRANEARVVMPSATKDKPGSGKLIAVVAGALAAAGSAAAYFLRK